MFDFFKQDKPDDQALFLQEQQKIAKLQEDIWSLNRDIRTLYEALIETQSTCTILMDTLTRQSNPTKPQPR